VYFVQSVSGVATLVLLKWATGGTLSAPTTPTADSNTAYYNSGNFCTAPCMTSLTFSGSSPTDTYSSPYYDPSSDTIYVGDDLGKLHKFSPVFNGALAEITTGGWPASVNTNASLGSPVFYNTGTASTSIAFVGDYPIGYLSNCQPPSLGTLSPCGYLYAVPSTGSTGSIPKTVQLDYNDGIIDSPILDASAGDLYVFAGQDNSTSCANSGPCAAVYEFPVGFTSGANATAKATVGAGYQFMMSGTFDNAYFTSAGGTGHMYVVGNTGPANNTLYQLSIATHTLNTSSTAGPPVATNYTNGYYAAGLQVSEYLNGSTDYIFLGVLAFGEAYLSGTLTACQTSSPTVYNSGCVIGFNVTSGAITTTSNATGELAEEGGSSGIVVDYVSSIYYSTLLNQSCTTPAVTAGCAIQTTQAAP